MIITPEIFKEKQSLFLGSSRTSTYVILEELLARGYSIDMPFWPNRIIRFTTPDHKVRTINGVMCWNTPALARFISSNKFAAYGIAGEACLPLADTAVYETPDQAGEFWDRHSGKAILKSAKGQGGSGVWVMFRDRGDFIEKAALFSKDSMILMQEKSEAPIDLRLLFISGEFVAATAREPFQVVGDGVSTVSQLLNTENERRKEANSKHHPSMALSLFDLQNTGDKAGRTADEVLGAKETLTASLANISSGGTAKDETESVHPDFVSSGKKIAKALNCPVIAIDFLCADPSMSFEDNTEKVIFLETNTRPGIDLHQYPHEGDGRNVAAKYIDYVLENCKQ